MYIFQKVTVNLYDNLFGYCSKIALKMMIKYSSQFIFFRWTHCKVSFRWLWLTLCIVTTLAVIALRVQTLGEIVQTPDLIFSPRFLFCQKSAKYIEYMSGSK